jgi:hypothetical protein
MLCHISVALRICYHSCMSRPKSELGTYITLIPSPKTSFKSQHLDPHPSLLLDLFMRHIDGPVVRVDSYGPDAASRHEVRGRGGRYCREGQ